MMVKLVELVGFNILDDGYKIKYCDKLIKLDLIYYNIMNLD